MELANKNGDRVEGGLSGEGWGLGRVGKRGGEGHGGAGGTT